MQSSRPTKILVFSRTAGYRHSSITAGIKALKEFAGASRSFGCDTSEDAKIMNPSSLSQYTVVVFLHNSGDFLDDTQLSALKAYMKNGGGFVGIHCASAGMLQNQWYGQLVGAAFTDHPEPQAGTVKIEDTEHVLTRGLPNEWQWHDEWYNFRTNPRDNVQVLMSIDESCYEGGKMGEDHPLAWCQEFQGGRSFYTSLGHFDEAWEDRKFHEHVTRGIYWAAGLL